MKIFLGMNNIASLMRDYKEGFTALGHECFCVSKYEHAIVDGPVDMYVPQFINALLRKKNDYSPQAYKEASEKVCQLAWQKALEADVCFFMWETFHPCARDLAELKRLGKRIIVRLCGSEVRDPHVDAQFVAHYGLQSTDYGLLPDMQVLRNKLCYLRQVEQYADVIIAGSSMSLRPTSWRGAYLFSQEGIVRRAEPQRKIPTILHAPSNKSTKGTVIWQTVFDMLKGAGLKFGLKFVENIPHADMLREYATADIVCGSLFYGGRATWEALAAGCVHLGVAPNEIMDQEEDNAYMLASLGKECTAEAFAWLRGVRDNFAPVLQSPNVGVSAENVAETLANLILDQTRRQAIADAGPAFIDTWFAPARTCQRLLDMLENPASTEQWGEHYLSAFFRHHYTPPENDPERIRIFNTYTHSVSHCDWYKTFVPRGERAGLIF